MEDKTVWYCDVCGDPVITPGLAMVAWDLDSDRAKSNFRIIHKGACDAGRIDSWFELRDVMGADGTARLLSLLSLGPLLGTGSTAAALDGDSFVDMFRRLHTPGYEEARRYFDDPTVREWAAEANEVLPYTQQGIRRIIELGRKAP